MHFRMHIFFTTRFIVDIKINLKTGFRKLGFNDKITVDLWWNYEKINKTRI